MYSTFSPRYSLLTFALAAAVGGSSVAHAQSSTAGAAPAPVTTTAAPTTVTYDGFVDTYYAYDFNAPPTFDRAYTTQPARSDEFNVNLAMLGATLSQERFRARLALQAGTSVQSNYAGEPAIGAVSGPSVSRSIQEAYVGTQLAENVWVDAGIYLSHVGAESFISRSNLTYTRSLVADYSPYYQSGVRLSYSASPKLSLQLHVVNGWQNISENNHSKMIGTQIAFTPSEKIALTYNTLLGREADFRQFHDFIVSIKPTNTLTLLGQADYGRQGASEWMGAMATAKYQIATNDAVVARIETYRDPDQVVVVTGSPSGFETQSASIGFDHALSPQVQWRNELRGFWTKDAIYPSAEGPLKRDAFVVTSLSAGF